MIPTGLYLSPFFSFFFLRSDALWHMTRKFHYNLKRVIVKITHTSYLYSTLNIPQGINSIMWKQ